MNIAWNTFTTSSATDLCTTISPQWTSRSNPRYDMRISRRFLIGTGHPLCHEYFIRDLVAGSMMVTRPYQTMA